MPKATSADSLLGSYTKRNGINPSTVDLSASADENFDEGAVEEKKEQIGTVQAMAVRGYNAISGPLQWVRATEHFYAAGELIQVGDYVEITEDDAKQIRKAGRCEFVTADEVTASQKGSKK